MDEINEKKKIASAMKEPAAPVHLVETMVQRAVAMERGRSALQQLKEADPQMTADRKNLLCAATVVGILASGKWPDNASADDLTEQLAENPAFRKKADLPADLLAEKISDGSFLKSFRKVPEKKMVAEEKTLTRKDPENAPVI